MAAARWQRVAIQSSSLVDGPDGHVVLTWDLPGAQEPAWVFAFTSAVQPRTGPAGFVYGPDPAVVDDRIHWTVPRECVQSATEEVLRRVGAANEQTRVLRSQQADPGRDGGAPPSGT
jgi:hypothetical protein